MRRRQIRVLILIKQTCMISPFKIAAVEWKLCICTNFTSRLTLIHVGISIMSFELIRQWCHVRREFEKQGFSLSAAVCYQLLLYIICVLCSLTSSQVRRGSQVSKVIQADDVNDGTDHSCMVLCGRRRTHRHIIIKHDWVFLDLDSCGGEIVKTMRNTLE